MKKTDRSYKYDCRTCPIRRRCIEDKNFGPGLKSAIIRRFESRTDTFETWDMLQQDCLRIREEQASRTGHTIPKSGLLSRLRQARETETETEPVQPATSGHVTALSTPRPPIVPTPTKEEQPARSSRSLCGLNILATQRLVRLPEAGEVVLGRFERGFSNPPDIDLSYDDGLVPSVSRRHALIIARGRRHWIEDMGSANGTYLNGYPLTLSESKELSAGDRLLLGRCRIAYSPLPDWALTPDPRKAHLVRLVITHTAFPINLPEQESLIIGRPDPTLGFVPDINLDIADDFAANVSRRHARLIARAGRHYLEDMGSIAGTRINGTPVHVNDPPVLLNPGDQIWLGGCVLAYEWNPL